MGCINILHISIIGFQMRRIRSCKNVKIQHISNTSEQTDNKYNFIVTNLIKTKLCHKQPCLDHTINAYDLAHLNKYEPQSIMNSLKFIEPSKKSYRSQLTKTVSQEEINKLISLQDFIQNQATQAFHISVRPVDYLPSNAKQLSQIKFNTLKTQLKQPQMVRRIMGNKSKKSKKQQVKKPNSNLCQSIGSANSIPETTVYESCKAISFIQSEPQQKVNVKKLQYFKNKLKTENFEQVYNTQRRQQARKGFMKGERKKIKEILNKHSPITLTNFVNINRKSNRKKSVKNFNQSKKKQQKQEQQQNNENSNFLQKQNLRRKFQTLCTEYRLGTK